MVKAEDIIKYKNVSKHLAGNDSIRKDTMPKKYTRKVNRLVYLINLWLKWSSNE